ncbi:MAG: tetratricopeptide repeat protein, partial [Pseudohongiellaceae bacterium]
ESQDGIISQLERELPQLNGVAADAARYGLALAQLESGQYVNASQTLDALLDKEPRRITYVMLQADIARAAQDYPRALDILEDNLKINPGNHPLTMNYAKTLELAGEFEQSARVLERHANQHPENMNLWYQLAEVQGRAGNISKVHQARAEYYLTIGEFSQARDQLNFALALEQDRLTIARLRQRQDDIRQIQERFYR